MPRKGKGSKTQPIQTPTGQTYGDAGVQEQAQEIVPLPQVIDAEIVEPAPRTGPQPGAMGSPFRQTEFPNESVMTGENYSQAAGPPLSAARAQQLPRFLHVMGALANNPYADDGMKEIVRRMEQFVPPSPRAR